MTTADPIIVGTTGLAPQLLRMVYRRRWLACGVAGCVFLLVAIFTLRATPIFQARAQILIDMEDPHVTTFKDVIEENKATIDYYQTQARILRSRKLARETLDRLNLWSYPQFAPEALAIDRFLGFLAVSPVRNSRLIDVTFESPDPQLAADVVNALTHAYIDEGVHFEFSAAQQASGWLRQQLDGQRKEVEATELSLQKYRERQDVVSPVERENIVMQKLTELNTALTRAKTERVEKEALYNQLRAVGRDGSDSVPAVLQVGLIQQLKSELAALQRKEAGFAERYGDRHPEIVQVRSQIANAQEKLRRELDKVVQSIRNDYLAAVANERTLAGAVEAQKQEALSLSRKAIEYGTLEREATTSREIFKNLLQRAKETGISGQLRTTNNRIVDEAERPLTPSSPNRTRHLLVGLMAGLFFGVAAAFLVEATDSRIKSPEEIAGLLNLRCLALLPSVDLRRGGVPGDFNEAVKGLRTSLSCSPQIQNSRAMLVTSAGPGEGKTMVATNIAVAFAQAGQRVLLIDADMRRPRLHDIFGREKAPGLSEVIRQAVKPSDAVRTTDTANLWLLPSGHQMANPSELLASPRFTELLSTAGRHFDWVILDSPPVMPVTDAAVAAHVTRQVLFVIGAEMPSRGEVQSALDRLASVDATIVGAVLNNVNLQRHPYYYRRYSRREYGEYFAPAT